MRNFFIRSAPGQNIIEVALMLPLLLILIGGITDLGVALFVSHTVQNAAREGARLAATLPALTANDPRVITAADSRIPNINLFSDFKSNITNTAPTGTDCDLTVTVTITGNYNFLLLQLIGFNSFQLTPDTTMRYEICD
jgi:Flp pilus assembly protein TadG